MILGDDPRLECRDVDEYEATGVAWRRRRLPGLLYLGLLKAQKK
jgi:hypothetical protein